MLKDIFNEQTDHVYIVAEMSANHNGSLKNALDTIDAAKKAGADAVKLQTYTADTLTLNCRKPDFIIKGGTLWDDKSLYELYQQAYTPWEWHEQLFARAAEVGIDIFSTPFDRTAVDFLEQFSPIAYKIASFEVTDYGLVRYIASKKRPVIISGGIASGEEMDDVVNICREEGNTELVLLKCTSEYPAPLEDANLMTIPDMRRRYGVNVGFSDHTAGIVAPVAATALGAVMIEKHFIIDRSIGGPDASFSLDMEEFTRMVRAVRDTEKMMGRADYSMTDKKKKSRQFARSLYAAENIAEGEVFTEKNVRSVRPGYGLHPKYLPQLLGRKAKRNFEPGDRLDEDCL